MHIMRWAEAACQVHRIQRSGVTGLMVVVVPIFRTVFHLIYYGGPPSCLMSKHILLSRHHPINVKI